MTTTSPLASRRATPAILVAGLLGGAATSAGIALTATSGWLVVRASERPIILTLLVAIVSVRTFGIARPFFRYLERVRSHDAALIDLAQRRTSVYAGLIPLTPARLGRRSRSEVLTGVVDDLTDTVEAQVRVTVPVLSSVVAGLMAVVLVALLWPAAGLVLAALLVAIAGACLLARALEARGQHAVLAARSEVQRVSDLVARHADDLRAVGGERRALEWLDAAHAVWGAATRRQSRGRALVAAMILIGTGVAAVACAVLATGADVSAPVAALLVVVPVAVGDALAPLAEAMRAQARAEASATRLTDVLSQTPAVAAASTASPASTALAARADADQAGVRADSDDGRADSQGEPTAYAPASTVPHLRLDSVTASWTGERTDLPPLTLDLPPGSRVAMVGANGSGKSTALAVLARHLDPTGGRYTVDGEDATAADLAGVRALFAVVDDEPHIFASSVRANLLVAAPAASDGAVRGALERAGLGRWLRGLPDGLDTALGTGGRGMSGGERARLAIARALLSERPVILLDEPVAHLDHASAVAIIADLLAATGMSASDPAASSVSSAGASPGDPADTSPGDSAGTFLGDPAGPATAGRPAHGILARTVVMVSHRPEGLDGFDRVLDLTPARL